MSLYFFGFFFCILVVAALIDWRCLHIFYQLLQMNYISTSRKDSKANLICKYQEQTSFTMDYNLLEVWKSFFACEESISYKVFQVKSV